jgi:hypothetical protein
MSTDARVLAGNIKRIQVKGKKIMGGVLGRYDGLRRKLEESWDGFCAVEDVQKRRDQVVAAAKASLQELQNLVTETEIDVDVQMRRGTLILRALYREKCDSESKVQDIWLKREWWRVKWLKSWFNLAELSDIQLDQLTRNLDLADKTIDSIGEVKMLLTKVKVELAGFDQTLIEAQSGQLRAEVLDFTVEELLEELGIRLNRTRVAMSRLELPPPER